LAEPAAPPSARTWVLIAAVAALGLGLLAWRFRWVNDDAYITFSYARSLAEGHGFVHHPSAQPVEGFTELLFTLWIALGIWLGLSPIPLALASTALAGLALALAIVAAVRRATGSAAAGAAVAIACAGCAPLAVWTTSGMGVAPFALAVFATYLTALRAFERPTAGATAALAVAASAAVLLRADGAWWVAWIVGAGLLWARRTPAGLRSLATGAAVSAAVFGAVTWWRLATFGAWVPNTAKAKLGLGARAFERGVDYAAHFVLTFPGALALFALCAFGAWRRRGAAEALALVGSAATVLHAVLVGGDFMAFGRFLVPALPLVLVGAGCGLAALPAGRARGAVQAACGVIAALGLALPAFDVHLTPTAWREAFRFRFNPGNFGAEQPFFSERQQWHNMRARAEEWGVVGRDLARLSRPDASVVAGAVGALGWHSRRRIFDRHGLLSREVAALPPAPERRSPGHDTFVGPEFFLAERPTFLEVGIWPRERIAAHPYAGRLVVLGASERDGYLLWGLPGPSYAP